MRYDIAFYCTGHYHDYNDDHCLQAYFFLSHPSCFCLCCCHDDDAHGLFAYLSPYLSSLTFLAQNHGNHAGAFQEEKKVSAKYSKNQENIFNRDTKLFAIPK